MKKNCRHCGIIFEDDSEKFCSETCKDEYIVGLAKRIQEAVKNDQIHIQYLSHN